MTFRRNWLPADTNATDVEERGDKGALFGIFRSYHSGLFAGKKAYIALRKHGEIYRDRCDSIGDAMRSKKAGWALDEKTVLAARAKGCFAIIIAERDTGDRWASRIEQWFEPANVKKIDWSDKGGSRQWVLRLHHFQLQAGVPVM